MTAFVASVADSRGVSVRTVVIRFGTVLLVGRIIG
jgi:hypothetical protein